MLPNANYDFQNVYKKKISGHSFTAWKLRNFSFTIIWKKSVKTTILLHIDLTKKTCRNFYKSWQHWLREVVNNTAALFEWKQEEEIVGTTIMWMTWFGHLKSRKTFAPSVRKMSLITADTAETHFKVIIIGGGLAGLSAAVHLVDHGVSGICVLEAKNNLGGRIKTVALDGSPLELGAQWIHGACTANSVFNLANRWESLHSNLTKRLLLDFFFFFFTNAEIVKMALFTNHRIFFWVNWTKKAALSTLHIVTHLIYFHIKKDISWNQSTIWIFSETVAFTEFLQNKTYIF